MNTLQTFRKIAILEGISYLLFAITMPMKYAWEMLLPNKIVGIVHGVLFIAYVLFLYFVAVQRKWNFTKIFILFVASLLPFATFVADKKILANETKEA